MPIHMHWGSISNYGFLHSSHINYNAILVKRKSSQKRSSICLKSTYPLWIRSYNISKWSVHLQQKRMRKKGEVFEETNSLRNYFITWMINHNKISIRTIHMNPLGSLDELLDKIVTKCIIIEKSIFWLSCMTTSEAWKQREYV